MNKDLKEEVLFKNCIFCTTENKCKYCGTTTNLKEKNTCRGEKYYVCEKHEECSAECCKLK